MRKTLRKLNFLDLGLAPYGEVWERQKALFQATIDHKIALRNGQRNDPTVDHLLFCEHPPVYTLGKSGKQEHLLISEADMKAQGIEFFRTDRGGDITFHGPGQLVGYPILDLDAHPFDLKGYIYRLEELFIRLLAHYGLKGERSPGETGVWLEVGTPRARKICAIGVRASRWVTMHGWAFNVNTDLNFFAHIVPCGIADKEVTSLAKELGKPQDWQAVKSLCQKHFKALFALEWHEALS